MDLPPRRRFDPDSARGPAPSPCLSICRLDPEARVCTACGRSLDEIIAWPRASEDEKRAVWRRINTLPVQASNPATAPAEQP